MPMNPMTLTDSYKLGHRTQYPEGTRRVYSNWTARESRVPGVEKVVFFGLQYFLQRYLMEEFSAFFALPGLEAARRYAHRVDRFLGPDNGVGNAHIRQLHELGYIPLEFRALPEGTHVPLRVPMFTVENTHDDFAWLTNYVETLLSSVIWMPITSATTASRFRSLLDDAAVRTGADPAFVQWQGHDFSFRGMPGPEAAALSGMGHLLFFTGTDTLPALDLAEEYYGPLGDDYLVGASVPATEHSVMCAGGQETERETFKRLLKLYPSGIVSVVSDTWDLWKVITEILPSLREQIMSRPGKLVIRPDSGDPADILCGDPKAPFGSPASKGVVRLLWEMFGGTETKTRHKLLDPHVGTIYGDGINLQRAKEITERLEANGFASTIPVLGIGSFSYQHVTRDTYGMAFKSTWVDVGGEGREIWKRPVTDTGMKNSARGRVMVTSSAGRLVLVDRATPEQEAASLLKPVWRDGKFLRRQTFADVRATARGV